MPDFLVGELQRQHLDQVAAAAEGGARRHELLRAVREARRSRRPARSR